MALPAVDPDVEVLPGGPVAGERVHLLRPVSDCFHRHPQAGVQQVVLAVCHLAGGQGQPAGPLRFDGALAVRQKHDESQSTDVGGRGIGVDQAPGHVPRWCQRCRPVAAELVRHWALGVGTPTPERRGIGRR